MNRLNPYDSPQTSDRSSLIAVEPGLDGSPRSSLDAARMLFRRIQIQSPIHACIEFNGRSLTDRLLIDGQCVAAQVSWWRISPSLRCEVALSDRIIPIEMELKTGMFLQITRFIIRVDGNTVYAEER